MKRTRFKGLIAVLLSTLGYGLMPLISSVAYESGTSVESLLFTRFLVAAVIIWTLVRFMGIPYRTTFRHFVYIVCFSLIGYTLCAHLVFSAYQYLTGSLVTMIVFLHPAMIVAWESVVGRKRPSSAKAGALFLTLAGLVIILWDPGAVLNWPGVLMSLGAAATYAYFCIAVVEPRTHQMSSLAVTAYVVTVSLAVYFGAAIAQHEPLIPQTITGFSMAVILGIVSTAFASLAFYWGIKQVGPSTAALASTFEPVFVALIGVLFIGETITWRFLLGSVLILGALLLLNKESSEPKTSPHTV